MVVPRDSFSNILRDLVLLRPAISEIHNFLKGFHMHDDYLLNKFSIWKGMAITSCFKKYFYILAWSSTFLEEICRHH